LKQEFYSNGKLLLTGEYVVLDGALSLAVPTSYGQSLLVENIDQHKLIWRSLDEVGNVWFEDEFNLTSGEIHPPLQNSSKITKRLFQILSVAKQLNPEFLKQQTGYRITTKLDFPRNWGLGSSSTLINNIANWANVNAYKLLEKTLGGSGYDIAAAQHKNSILYNIINGKGVSKEVNLNWNFTKQLFFIHLNKKQNSREGIVHYQSQIKNNSHSLIEINKITSKIIVCKHLNEFETLLLQHENIISNIIKLKPIKELLFKDYTGAIKSLGAWGGDFILVTGENEAMDYFRKKGYKTIIPFRDMIK